jgi:hypothetical protein
MGNSSSSHTVQYSKEVESLKNVVSSIINEKDTFINKDYNFLSKDVCNQHYIVMQQELNKHLKIELEALGTSMYIIPKNDDEKLTKLNITKKEICEMISSHYIKILYVLCLIKYVYNLEHNGDMSIAGIVFRNIKILDDIMQIDFCQMPHKDVGNKNATRINLGLLEGMQFFSNYFLKPEEAGSFLGLMKTVLAKKKQSAFTNTMCTMMKNTKFTKEEIKEMEALYERRYGKKIVCTPDKVLKEPVTGNLFMYIEKENPIFSSKMCYSANQVVVKLNTKEGRIVSEKYNQMKDNYTRNIKSIHVHLDKLVAKDGNGGYVLKDVKKPELENIIESVKVAIKVFYLQSIMDFHALLEKAKESPNFNLVQAST